MNTNFWKRDETRQEIITKTLIPNENNFDLFATYFNLMDAKGLSFHLPENIDIETEKLFSKNGIEYFVLQHDSFKEFLVLPNENLEIFVDKIILKINSCDNVYNVFDLVLDEMN